MSKNVFKRGMIVVVSAPSGAGKTTLCRRLIARDPARMFSVSMTTRPSRGREREGSDYYFVTDKRFTELVGAKGFAEWAQVHGARYGTPRAQLDRALSAGRTVFLDIDVQGGFQIRKNYPEAVLIFVMPPSMNALADRLRGRGTDSAAVIKQRLAASRREIERGKGYEFFVVNDDLKKAVRDIECILRAAQLRRVNSTRTRSV